MDACLEVSYHQEIILHIGNCNVRNPWTGVYILLLTLKLLVLMKVAVLGFGLLLCMKSIGVSVTNLLFLQI